MKELGVMDKIVKIPLRIGDVGASGENVFRECYTSGRMHQNLI